MIAKGIIACLEDQLERRRADGVNRLAIQQVGDGLNRFRSHHGERERSADFCAAGIAKIAIDAQAELTLLRGNRGCNNRKKDAKNQCKQQEGGMGFVHGSLPTGENGFAAEQAFPQVNQPDIHHQQDGS